MQKILVVDDERKMVKLIRTYLEAGGYQVVAAYDGQEALTMFRHEQPDLIILDLMLPQIDGFDVARTIRRSFDTPIIMLTDIAHELRTPLSLMQGNLEAILDGMYELNMENVASVHEETLVLTRLVNDLRDLSLAEAGQLPLEQDKVDLTLPANQ